MLTCLTFEIEKIDVGHIIENAYIDYRVIPYYHFSSKINSNVCVIFSTE